VLIGAHYCYAVGVEVCEGVDWVWLGGGGVGGGEEAEEGAGGEVGVAFCLCGKDSVSFRVRGGGYGGRRAGP